MPKKKLTIAHNNDLHGDFLPHQADGRTVGGVSQLSGYISDLRDKGSTLYVISGDMFRGSVIDSEFKGISTIEIVNLLQPDVVTIGNHEIDYGVSHLLFLEKCARFPIINANLFIKLNHARLFSPYKIVEIDGIKVMFIGIITEEVLDQAKTGDEVGSFIDVAEAAKEIGVICDNYKTTDVDLTVLLTHIGFEQDKLLANLLDPKWGVDLIIGGHSHTELTEACLVNGYPIVQASSGSAQLGRFDLEIDTDTHSLTHWKWECVPINNKTCRNDDELSDLIEKYKSETDQKYNRVLTRFPRALTHPARNMETELGNLFADLMQQDSSFDIFFLGSGSLRLKSLGPILTYQGLLEFFPYDDEIHMFEVTGEELGAMVKYLLREEAFTGETEFYQFSKGLRVVYSRSEQAIKELTFKDKPVMPEDHFKVALQTYHFSNFEKFFGVPFEPIKNRFKPRIVVTAARSIYDELLSSGSRFDAHVEGRITILP